MKKKYEAPEGEIFKTKAKVDLLTDSPVWDYGDAGNDNDDIVQDGF